MLRFSIIFFASLLLAISIVTVALAQDVNSDVSTSSRTISPDTSSASVNGARQSAESNTLKLFAGVSHREVVPPVHEAMKPYLEKAQTAAGQKVTIHDFDIPADLEKPAAAIAPSARKEISSAQTHAADLSAQSAHAAPALRAQATVNQTYMPAFGVAREMAIRPDTPAVAQPQQHYTIQWFMIPSWMAGVWLKNGDMTTSVTDFQTGMSSNQNEWTENHLENTWGHQQDAQGNYWHANLLPEERDGLSAGKLVRFLVVERSMEKSSAEQLVTRVHYLVSESNPWNHQPIDSFQQESLNHYSLSDQGHMLNSSSNRVFTYQGQPVREGHLYSEFAKIGQYAPVATLKGVDLKTSLNDYLQAHGMGNLRK